MSKRGARAGAVGAAVVILVAAGGVTAPATAAGAADDSGGEYVALGDSYAAGYGALGYLSGATDLACGRSRHSYPYLHATKAGMTLHFTACQGATTAMVLTSQLGPLNGRTKLVTLQVGGNDSGFLPTVMTCLAPANGPVCVAFAETATTFTRTALPRLLDGVYDRVSRKAPAAEVVVVGYPRIFSEKDKDFCQPGAWLTRSERKAANEVTVVLNQTVRASAERHGFTYVDPLDAFSGHAVCDSDPWLEGLVSTPPTRSFHPNRGGNEAFLSLLEKATG